MIMICFILTRLIEIDNPLKEEYIYMAPEYIKLYYQFLLSTDIIYF